jgi:RNA polymerase sigma-70 factor (ECF subfamily)
MDRADLRAFLDGDSNAFERIYERHHQALIALCTRYLRDAGFAVDVVQQTFCSALPHLAVIAAQGNIAAWLRRSATNLCIDELRRRVRAARIFAPPLEAASGTACTPVEPDPRRNPEAALERAQQREAVRAAAARLPDRLRTALVLREMHGLSHRAVSRRMGISLVASEALVYRARARFRREYLSVSRDAVGPRLSGQPRATWSPPSRIGERQELQHAG